MENHPLYGKRKKKVGPCPNPLFCFWLQEWKDDAAEKGIKTQYVYAKALKSLKNYPLPIASGRDCKMLEYFGDKICKMLDDKLIKHIAEYGSIDYAPFLQEEIKKKVTKSMKEPVKSTEVHHISSSESEHGEEAARPNSPRKRQRSGTNGGGREYIPVFRSGPYALLLTLYKHSQSDTDRPYMSKAELIRQAQHLADKSFSIPDPGCRYTAWSSMGILINKGFVIKESYPAKYSLTEAGCALAHRLQAVGDGNDICRPSTSGRTTVHAQENGRPVLPENNKNDITFKYVTDSNEEVITKDKAAVLINDDIGFGFLIKCNYQKLLSSGFHYKLDTSRPMTNHVYAYIKDSDAPDLALGLSPLPMLPMVNDVPHPLKDRHTVQDINKDRSSDSSVQTQVKKPRQRKPKDLSSNPSASLKLLPLIEDLPPVASLPTTNSLLEEDSQSSLTSIKSISSVSSVQCIPRPDFFVLKPGEFDVVLCIDNREFYGGGKKGSKNLLPDLMKNGVNCDLRELQVGDLLWIAKQKQQFNLSDYSLLQNCISKSPEVQHCLKTRQGFIMDYNSKPKELVLDYIVERKRMDDLVHSCTDGRLKDQKFRLKHCGVRCPIFLIEDHGSMQHFSIPESTIKQTITNLGVIDGFQVKRTKGSKESVAYLTVMTRHLQQLYNNKTLYACSVDEIHESNNIVDINDSEQRLVTFEHLNLGSVKSKVLTAQEMFGKQLIQLNGMSAEKAKSVSNRYRTIKELLSAYNECKTEKDKETMLSGIKCGKSMRSLGTSQSRQIYQLYCTKGPLM